MSVLSVVRLFLFILLRFIEFVF